MTVEAGKELSAAISDAADNAAKAIKDVINNAFAEQETHDAAAILAVPAEQPAE